MRFLSAYPLLIVSALLGCSKSNEQSAKAVDDQAYFNDFEGLQYWNGVNDQSIVKGDAHSGRYAVKVDAQTEFGSSFKAKINQLTSAKLIRVEVTGWAKINSPAGSALVVLSVTKPENSAGDNYWNGLNYHDQVKDFGKWVRIKKEFTMPANLNPDSELACYLWRSGASEPALIDDLQIRLQTE